MPRLLALLADLGVIASKRQLVLLLIDGQDAVLDAARDGLRSGLDTAPWITVDDTGARHKSKTAVCAQIGNAPFTSFSTTGSESRLNFLELLNAGGRLAGMAFPDPHPGMSSATGIIGTPSIGDALAVRKSCRAAGALAIAFLHG